jgi:hypothetical protein
VRSWRMLFPEWRDSLWTLNAGPMPSDPEWLTGAAAEPEACPGQPLRNWIVPGLRAVTALTFALLDDIIEIRKLAADVPVKRLRRGPRPGERASAKII